MEFKNLIDCCLMFIKAYFLLSPVNRQKAERTHVSPSEKSLVEDVRLTPELGARGRTQRRRNGGREVSFPESR